VEPLERSPLWDEDELVEVDETYPSGL
jgi:hypothetical protein